MVLGGSKPEDSVTDVASSIIDLYYETLRPVLTRHLTKNGRCVMPAANRLRSKGCVYMMQGMAAHRECQGMPNYSTEKVRMEGIGAPYRREKHQEGKAQIPKAE